MTTEPMTSTSTNERIEAIRKLYKSAEWLEDDYGQTLIEVEKLGEVLKHAEALAARAEEREAQLRLIAPVVSAALEMVQWEGSTDYPDGDPEVIKRRRAFRDALYHLDDLHYDELDFLDDFQPGDLPPNDGSN